MIAIAACSRWSLRLPGRTTGSSAQARIIFPKLEPFGHDLDSAFTNPADSAALRQKYLFYPLYDTIKEVAKTNANLDRYIISGTAKGQSTSEISWGAFNVPPGSVNVSAGGQVLKENYDYTVDYNLGTVKIINQAIINSGVPVSVQYENNASYGIQNRNYIGARADYVAKNTAREQLSFGGTLVRLGNVHTSRRQNIRRIQFVTPCTDWILITVPNFPSSPIG
jgi:cell surface protein SprA